MNNLYYLFTLFTICVSAQTDLTTTIQSKILDEDRYLSVHLPRSYNDSISKKYPLIITLDGENLYYFTVANSEIYYDPDPDFQVIPETIIVGIKQNYNYKNSENLIRGKDASYSTKTGLINKNAIQFKDFIYNELLPFLKINYRINDFSAIIGHSLTATFVSNLLLEDNDRIKAFIAISPNLPEELTTKINTYNYKNSKIYYNSTGSFDLPDHKTTTQRFNSNFNCEQLIYKYDFFQNENHTSLISRSLPNAIKHIFVFFKPTSEEVIKDLLKSSNKLKFLEDFKKNAKNIYNEEITISNSDFLEYYDYIENNVTNYWSVYKEIADIHLKILPETEAYYALGKYEEQHTKNYKKALFYYQKGYDLLEDNVSNKTSFQKDIDRVKKLLIKK